MADCLFCKIVSGEIKGNLVYQDEHVTAFRDLNPQAPTHILICPKKHFASLEEATQSEQAVLGKIALVAAKLARERKLGSGYRTVVNTGSGAGQTVFHLHMHLLGVRAFHWPPG